MTRRRDLIRTIRNHARKHDLPIRIEEGGRHTRIWMGTRYTTLPRHNEIPDNFARKILKQIGITE